MEEKKVSKTGNKYYEVILDWFRQQILSGQMKEGDHDSFRTGAGCSVWCKQGSGAGGLKNSGVYWNYQQRSGWNDHSASRCTAVYTGS